jgi:PIN domain nuclease of toxin-antitoxin system
MRYLIDANILLFMLGDKDRLTSKVKDILGDYGSRKYISAESVKEIVHLWQCGKFSSKKQMFTGGVLDFINNETELEIKPIKEEHLKTLEKLPIIHDHKDPSDRMIIAQAITEKIPLVSSDRMFPHYKKFGLELIFNDY